MKSPRLRTLLLFPLVFFISFYAIGAAYLFVRDKPQLAQQDSPQAVFDIAIFGASGTAGDGILKAALASPDIGSIKIITRRITPRIQSGVSSGKIQAIKHLDYLDYSEIEEQFKKINTVYWAIGISSLGIDEDTYGKIHVDFPMAFVKSWDEVNKNPNKSFHFISSSDISENSNTMWVREKIRAEKYLFEFGDNRDLKVIAYRPDYIKPTIEEIHLGQNALYWFFRPVGAAVKASEIGNAMIESTIRNYSNRTKHNTLKIIQLGETYQRRIPDKE